MGRCSLRPVRITLLPHARRRMEERGISEEEIREVLESPDREYPGNSGRTVAERVPLVPLSRSLAVKVVYDLGLEDERIVVTVELGRPARQEGDEQ